MRKNIDLPEKTINQLKRMAKSSRMKVKPFIEKMLIGMAAIEVIVTKPENEKLIRDAKKRAII